MFLKYVGSTTTSKFNKSNEIAQLWSTQFSRSIVTDSATPWTTAHQASLSITNSQSLLKLLSIESVMPSNHLILCHSLVFPPSIFPSIRVFSSESALCMRWPKYWSFSFNISPSNEHSGPISFKMDWLDLFAVQGTQESSPTPQFKSINSSVLSFLYSPTLTSIHDSICMETLIALTRRTFVGKVMSLLFNMLSRLVIVFLPRSKRLNFMASVTICSDFNCFPIYLPWSNGTRCHDHSFLNDEF